jgi:hypothetical protein
MPACGCSDFVLDGGPPHFIVFGGVHVKHTVTGSERSFEHEAQPLRNGLVIDDMEKIATFDVDQDVLTSPLHSMDRSERAGSGEGATGDDLARYKQLM